MRGGEPSVLQPPPDITRGDTPLGPPFYISLLPCYCRVQYGMSSRSLRYCRTMEQYSTERFQTVWCPLLPYSLLGFQACPVLQARPTCRRALHSCRSSDRCLSLLQHCAFVVPPLVSRAVFPHVDEQVVANGLSTGKGEDHTPATRPSTRRTTSHNGPAHLAHTHTHTHRVFFQGFPAARHQRA